MEFRSKNYKIILLSETWLKWSSPKFKIQGFDTVRCDRTGGNGGGTAILVKNSIQYTQYPLDLSSIKCIETCAIQIKWRCKPLIIISVYIPPQAKVTKTDLLKFFSQFNSDYILGGDFNAHHTNWGNVSNCNKDIAVYDAILQSNQVILNNGEQTYCPHWRSVSSAIDLTIVSSSLMNYCGWNTLTENWGSDHRPIEIQLEGNITYNSRFNCSQRHHTVKTNWPQAIQNLNNQLPDLEDLIYNNLGDIQVQYTSLISSITSCVRRETPGKSKPNFKDNPSTRDSRNSRNTKVASWWTQDCEKLIKTRKEAYDKFKENSSRDNFIKFIQIKAKTKIELRKAKKSHFEDFCCSLNKSSNMSFVWNRVKRMSKGFYKNENANEYNPAAKREVEKAIEELCPPWVELPPQNFSDTVFDDLFEAPFTIEEFETVLKNAKPKSSPGMDGIDYFLISQIPLEYKYLLLDMLNKIYFSGDFPSEWHDFLVFFIPKKDKNKYRPISLAQVPLKVLEKMVYTRLAWWVEHNNILPNNQFGFRKDSSCNDNIAILASHINLHFQNDEDTAALFLDIKGAFDNVLCEVLIEKLKSLKLSYSAIKFIYNVIHSRKITVRFDDIDCKRICFKGLPQGSVLSPLLYAIYICDINKAIVPVTETQLLSFTDDTCIYNTDMDTERALDNLEVSANILLEWFANRGLELSVNKTAFLVFSNNKLRAEHTYQIEINNKTIDSTNEVRFLGVIFQKNLNWNSHIQKITASSGKTLNLLKFLTHTWWGASPDLLLMLYNALVRSRIEYAPFI